MYDKGEAPYLLKMIRVCEMYGVSLRELTLETKDNIDLMLFVKECDLQARNLRENRERLKQTKKLN